MVIYYWIFHTCAKMHAAAERRKIGHALNVYTFFEYYIIINAEYSACEVYYDVFHTSKHPYSRYSLKHCAKPEFKFKLK